jgi:hypothetical protein
LSCRIGVEHALLPANRDAEKERAVIFSRSNPPPDLAGHKALAVPPHVAACEFSTGAIDRAPCDGGDIGEGITEVVAK